MKLPKVTLQSDPFEQGLVDILARNGWAFLTGVTDTSELHELGGRLGAPWRHRTDDETGSTTLYARDPEETSERGYLPELLPMHTESSLSPIPPVFLLIWCSEEASRGGEAMLCDSRAVYERMRESDPAALALLEEPEAQQLRVEPPQQMPVFDSLREGWRFVRHRRDAIVHHPPTVADAYRRFVELVDATTISFVIRKGEGYIINNGQMIHGRAAYEGPRRLHRVTASVHHRWAAGENPIDLGFPVMRQRTCSGARYE